MHDYIPDKLYKQIQEHIPILNVDAIMYNSKNEIYFQFRKVIPHKNKWTLLGGRLRKYESVQSCLERHVSESGLRILDSKFVGYYDWRKCDSRQHSMSLVFLVRVEDGTPTTGKFFPKLPSNMPVSVRTCVQKFYNKETKK